MFPYLLRGLKIERPHQVWAIDITYVRLRGGFAYWVALLEWFSRYVLAWELAPSLETLHCLRVLEAALAEAGSAAQIVNSDQGSQFTGREWIEAVQAAGMQISHGVGIPMAFCKAPVPFLIKIRQDHSRQDVVGNPRRAQLVNQPPPPVRGGCDVCVLPQLQLVGEDRRFMHHFCRAGLEGRWRCSAFRFVPDQHHNRHGQDNIQYEGRLMAKSATHKPNYWVL